MTRDSADTVVVGAGPAGCAAAITLAQAGHSVTVIDRARFPRDKTCGDGLTTVALRQLADLGLDPTTVASWTPVDRFSIRSPSGRRLSLPLPRGRGLYAAVARRTDLDAALLEVARTAGARVREGLACTAVDHHDGHVQVHLDDGTSLTAGFLVGADGMWSPTRRHLGVHPVEGYRGDLHALRQYVSGVSGRATRELLIWFEPDVLPGYAWSFPLPGGRANVGLAVWRDGSYPVGAMGRLWPQVLARPHIASVLGPEVRPEGPTRAWPIPARVDRMRWTAGRALWVGDAIAACDPMTGEGIGQALATGRWAADAISAHHLGGPAAVRAAYEQQVTRGLVADHRMAMTLVRALSHRKGNRFPLWLVDQSDWSRRNFARWLWEDYPRGLLLTPSRWRRGVLSQGGATFPTPPATEPVSSG